LLLAVICCFSWSTETRTNHKQLSANQPWSCTWDPTSSISK
jgi:hypothetical protein